MKEEKWIVYLDIIGFVNPVGVVITAFENETEEEIIKLAIEHIEQTRANDVSFVGIKRGEV